jgi:hypothetical protein
MVPDARLPLAEHVQRDARGVDGRVEPIVRQRECQHLVDDEAQRVDVGRGRGHAPVELFGRGVLARSREGPRVGSLRRLLVGERADAEIEQLRDVRAVALLGDVDVLGLDVAVHDSELVGV